MNGIIRKVGRYYVSFYDDGNKKLHEVEAKCYTDALNAGYELMDDNLKYYSFRIDRAIYNSLDKNFKWDYEAQKKTSKN